MSDRNEEYDQTQAQDYNLSSICYFSKIQSLLFTTNNLEKAFSPGKFAISENWSMFQLQCSAQKYYSTLDLKFFHFCLGWQCPSLSWSLQLLNKTDTVPFSKEQKIHRLSSEWRGTFQICNLDFLGITLGMNE